MPARIELQLVKGSPSEQLWNALIEKHHYLGYRVHVGRCLKYIIRGDGSYWSHQFFISSVEVGCERQPVVPIGICSKYTREL